MNLTILKGRLTADPELRQTQSGISSCNFTIAVDRGFVDKASGERKADFIRCIAWRSTAEFVSKYFSKGNMILVKGALRNNNYQDKNHSDVMHYTLDVMVDEVEFCESKGNGSTGTAPTTPPAQAVISAAQSQGIDTMTYGDTSDFEEILSDGDVPF